MRRRASLAGPLVGLLGIAAGAGCASAPYAFTAGDLPAESRIAVLPPMNYSERLDATDRLVPVLLAQLAGRPGVDVIDAGRVENAIAREPWLLLDRVPPDLLDGIAEELGADALLVGSVLAYGYREEGSERVPEFSVVLRLLETPGGRALWSIAYSRDGRDREHLFGIGREESLEKLVDDSVRELLATFPQLRGNGKKGRSS